MIEASEITKGNLLGRGAFGFVFKATLKKASDKEGKSVAMKMLQPVQPGIWTRKVDSWRTFGYDAINLILDTLFFSERIVSL